MELYLTQNK